MFSFFAPHAADRARTGLPLLDFDRQMLKSEWRYKLGSHCDSFAACEKSVGCDPKGGVPLHLERFLGAEPLRPPSDRTAPESQGEKGDRTCRAQ